MDTQISSPYPESWRQGLSEKSFPKAIKGMPESEVVEYNIHMDHIHMVMIIPPRYAVGEVVGKIKGVTASLLRKKFS